MYIDPKATPLKKAQLFGLLERLCENLEPTLAQMERAETSYEAVGQWLGGSPHPWLASSSIYLQGSTALGTTVKPIGQTEYDVDLVNHLANMPSSVAPATCKQLVGDRLKEHQRYQSILEEKPRCWRLNYSGDFHLDITPSAVNPACPNRGELVPDKALKCWKPSNPKGYRDAFKRRAELVPQMRVLESMMKSFAQDSADIEPFPKRERFKGLLCRIVQIAKRHRDIYFLERDEALLPISVIVTTLAAWSYEFCVKSYVYDSELDVLIDVIRHMPDFIQSEVIAGQRQWFIWNETTAGENFAERWNSDPRRAKAFYEWHQAALSGLQHLIETEGLDRLSKSLGDSFGQAPAADVLNELYAGISTARKSGTLSFSRAAGLTGIAAARSTPVKANTFFGAP